MRELFNPVKIYYSLWALGFVYAFPKQMAWIVGKILRCHVDINELQLAVKNEVKKQWDC